MNSEIKALASDDTVWKAATGLTKKQFLNPSKMLYTIFHLSGLKGSALSKDYYIVPAEVMQDALIGLGKQTPPRPLKGPLCSHRNTRK